MSWASDHPMRPKELLEVSGIDSPPVAHANRRELVRSDHPPDKGLTRAQPVSHVRHLQEARREGWQRRCRLRRERPFGPRGERLVRRTEPRWRALGHRQRRPHAIAPVTFLRRETYTRRR